MATRTLKSLLPATAPKLRQRRTAKAAAVGPRPAPLPTLLEKMARAMASLAETNIEMARTLVHTLERGSLAQEAELQRAIELQVKQLERLVGAFREVELERAKGQTPAEPDLIGTEEAAEILGCSRPHVTKLIDTGVLPLVDRLGRIRRVSRKSVLAYLERRQAEAREAVREHTRLNEDLGLDY